MKRKLSTRIASLILALAMSFTCLTTASASSDVKSFADVKSTAWYYNDVMECAKLGIVTGYADGKFHPDDNVTSVQFIVMLTRTFYGNLVDALAATTVGSTWYWAHEKAANKEGVTENLPALSDTPMSRYDMALALYNILNNNGKGYETLHTSNLSNSAPDYNSISQTKYANAVATCYYYGVLTGTGDGSFAGTQNMTRAQACTVIVRMLKLIDSDISNGQYNSGTSQQPEQPKQPETKKLANGKDITIENVNEILAEVQRKYPEGMKWDESDDPDNNYYAAGETSYDVRGAVRKYPSDTQGHYTSTVYACGGFAAMVSDAIFGQTGFPAREVTRTEDLRPGDIYITMNAKNNTLGHVSIVLGIDANGYVLTCDGNSANVVNWNGPHPPLEYSTVYNYYIAFTRYPE